jgi:Fic family protein
MILFKYNIEKEVSVMQYELLSKIFYKNNADYEHTYLKRFENDLACRYNFTINENQAFVEINMEILNLITNILQLDKRLFKATQSIPPIALIQFTKKCLVDEIKLTNEIEGVHSTRKEIKELIHDKNESKKTKRLQGLVQKYLMLLDSQRIELKSCQDIRKLYDEFILTEIKEEDPKNIPDGENCRKEGVDIVSPSQKVIHKGLYPETKIVAAMTTAIEVLNDSKMNYFINIAIFHYMFGYIHPFYDGNGRMGRFISSYLLAQKLEPVVGFGISYTIKNKIKKYYDMFKETNDYKNKGDLTPFVIGFLEIIAESIEHLCSTLEARAEQFYFYSDKIEKYAGGNKNFSTILYILVQNSLFADDGISIQDITRITELSSSTVRTLLKQIPEEMLIIKQTGKMNMYDINLEVVAKI